VQPITHPSPGVFRAVAFAIVLMALPVLLVACDTTDDDDPLDLGTGGGASTAEATSTAIDRAAILGSVQEVQTFLEDASSRFDAGVISDVDYAGDTLSVTVTEDVAVLEDAQELCTDLADSVAAADLSIIVRNGTGAELAACRFRG